MRAAPLPRRGPFLGLAAALLAAALSPTAPAQERPAGLASAASALVGGMVHPAPGAEPFVGTVVVRDGLIVAAGPADTVTAPADAEEIDCEGLHLYAGFLDAATDRPLDEKRMPDPADGRKVNQSRYVLAATRTDNRRGLTPEFSAQQALAEDGKAMKALREAGFTAVHLVPRGRIAAGKTAFVTTADAPLRETLAAEGLFAAADLSRLAGREYPNTLMGTFAHLRQALADAKRHTLHRELWEDGAAGVPRPPADPALEALAEVLDGTTPPLFAVTTADDARRAAHFAAEYDLSAALAAGPRLRDAPGVWAADDDRPIVLTLDFGKKPERRGYDADKDEATDGDAAETDEEPTDEEESDDADQSEEEDEETAPADVRRPEPLRAYRARLARWREAVATPALLHRGGVRFALSSRGLKSPGELLKNLRLAVTAGLPEDAALAALTADAADLLGQGRRLGTLDAGRQAHVVALTGPWTHEKAKVRHLLIDRERYEFNEKAKPIDPADDTRSASVRPQAGAGGRVRRGSRRKPVRTASPPARRPAGTR